MQGAHRRPPLDALLREHAGHRRVHLIPDANVVPGRQPRGPPRLPLEGCPDPDGGRLQGGGAEGAHLHVLPRTRDRRGVRGLRPAVQLPARGLPAGPADRPLGPRRGRGLRRPRHRDPRGRLRRGRGDRAAGARGGARARPDPAGRPRGPCEPGRRDGDDPALRLDRRGPRHREAGVPVQGPQARRLRRGRRAARLPPEDLVQGGPVRPHARFEALFPREHLDDPGRPDVPRRRRDLPPRHRHARRMVRRGEREAWRVLRHAWHDVEVRRVQGGPHPRRARPGHRGCPELDRGGHPGLLRRRPGGRPAPGDSRLRSVSCGRRGCPAVPGVRRGPRGQARPHGPAGHRRGREGPRASGAA